MTVSVRSQVIERLARAYARREDGITARTWPAAAWKDFYLSAGRAALELVEKAGLRIVLPRKRKAKKAAKR